MLTDIQVYRLSIQAMKKEIQGLAVAANLHDLYNMDWPDNIEASKRRKMLKQAVEILAGKIEQCKINPGGTGADGPRDAGKPGRRGRRSGQDEAGDQMELF